MAIEDRIVEVGNELPPNGEGLFNDLMAEKQSEQTVTQTQTYEIPDKFKGKSLEDVVKSYVELESKVGSQGQELGELRKLADQFIQTPTAPQYGQAGSRYDATQDIDFDSLDEPDKVKAVLERELSPVRNELFELKKEKLNAKLKSEHPDFMDLVAQRDFQEWVMKSPVRMEMFARADRNFEYEAANELFTTYKAVKGIQATKVAEQVRDAETKEAFSQSRMETGSAEDTRPKKVYRRADIIDLKIRNPERYRMLEQEILQAYAEGRVR